MACNVKNAARFAVAVLLSICCVLFTAAVPAHCAERTIGNLPTLLKAESNGQTALVTQTGLGGAAADAALSAGKGDIALLPGEDIYANLLSGDVTESALQKALIHNRTLYAVTVSPAELKEIMETGVSHLTLNDRDKSVDDRASEFKGFPQVGGFTYRADLSAPVGQRILEIRLADGRSLDLQDRTEALRLISTEPELLRQYGYPVDMPAESLEITEADALAALIRNGGLAAGYNGTDRETLLGTTDNSLAAEYHLGILSVIGIALILGLTCKERFTV